MMTEKEEEIILFNCVYDTEFQAFRNTPEEEFQELYKEAEKNLKELDSKYCEPIFIKIVAIATIVEGFSNELVIERYREYVEALNFLETEGHQEIYSNYGIVISKKGGKYSLDTSHRWKDDIVKRTLIENEGFTSGTELMNDVQEIVNQKWKDKTQMISSEKLNQFTKEDEGINFKQFLFCEEYLKTGKIKSTCEILGIGRTTAYNYLKEEDVQKYLKDRKEEMQKENEANRKKTFNECFDKLQEIMNEDFGDTADKIRAIDVYLKHYSNIFMRKNDEV